MRIAMELDETRSLRLQRAADEAGQTPAAFLNRLIDETTAAEPSLNEVLQSSLRDVAAGKVRPAQALLDRTTWYTQRRTLTARPTRFR